MTELSEALKSEIALAVDLLNPSLLLDDKDIEMILMALAVKAMAEGAAQERARTLRVLLGRAGAEKP